MNHRQNIVTNALNGSALSVALAVVMFQGKPLKLLGQ
jgi:hypothetical protein